MAPRIVFPSAGELLARRMGTGRVYPAGRVRRAAGEPAPAKYPVGNFANTQLYGSGEPAWGDPAPAKLLKRKEFLSRKCGKAHLSQSIED